MAHKARPPFIPRLKSQAFWRRFCKSLCVAGARLRQMIICRCLTALRSRRFRSPAPVPRPAPRPTVQPFSRSLPFRWQYQGWTHPIRQPPATPRCRLWTRQTRSPRRPWTLRGCLWTRNVTHRPCMWLPPCRPSFRNHPWTRRRFHRTFHDLSLSFPRPSRPLVVDPRGGGGGGPPAGCPHFVPGFRGCCGTGWRKRKPVQHGGSRRGGWWPWRGTGRRGRPGSRKLKPWRTWNGMCFPRMLRPHPDISRPGICGFTTVLMVMCFFRKVFLMRSGCCPRRLKFLWFPAIPLGLKARTCAGWGRLSTMSALVDGWCRAWR